MPTLQWDQVGERTYQAGLDRGVLYLKDGTSVPWNGLTAVDEESDMDNKSYYIDGIKYLEHSTPGDFSASLKAITYPDEFEQCEGVKSSGSGLFFHDQQPTYFGLSYRTRLGNDVDGLDLGYRIHILYNLLAKPDNRSYASLSDQASPMEFGWSLSGTPMVTPGHKPTAHVSFKSTDLDEELLARLEDVLYGTALTDPYLPSPQDLIFLVQNRHSVLIHDNGDGTWTAMGPDDLIIMDDATTFRILGVPAIYSDADTFTIPTTDP